MLTKCLLKLLEKIDSALASDSAREQRICERSCIEGPDPARVLRIDGAM